MRQQHFIDTYINEVQLHTCHDYVHQYYNPEYKQREKFNDAYSANA